MLLLPRAVKALPPNPLNSRRLYRLLHISSDIGHLIQIAAVTFLLFILDSTQRVCGVTDHRHTLPVRLSLGGCSFQFGLTSI
jgi:hypothetical protein